MDIKVCQREMRIAFLGGFAGQMVSGIIWLAAAAVSTWINPRFGMATLFFGSMLIFPLTQGSLRLMGNPVKVSGGNELWQLGSQIAFTVPINFLLVGAATLYRENWFFHAVRSNRIEAQVFGQLKQEHDMKIRNAGFSHIQKLNGMEQVIKKLLVALLFPDRFVKYFSHKKGQCAFHHLVWNGAERNQVFHFLHPLDVAVWFVINVHIQNEQGLQNVCIIHCPPAPYTVDDEGSPPEGLCVYCSNYT